MTAAPPNDASTLATESGTMHMPPAARMPGAGNVYGGGIMTPVASMFLTRVAAMAYAAVAMTTPSPISVWRTMKSEVEIVRTRTMITKIPFAFIAGVLPLLESIS